MFKCSCTLADYNQGLTHVYVTIGTEDKTLFLPPNLLSLVNIAQPFYPGALTFICTIYHFLFFSLSWYSLVALLLECLYWELLKRDKSFLL